MLYMLICSIGHCGLFLYISSIINVKKKKLEDCKITAVLLLQPRSKDKKKVVGFQFDYSNVAV